MKSTLNLMVIILILNIKVYSQSTSSDIILKYDPSWSFPLGAGVNQNFIYSSKVDCIEHDGIDWIDGGAVSTNFESKLVTTYEELIKELNLSFHFDISASLGISDISGSGESSLDLKYYKYFKRESNSMTLLIKASSNYGRRAVLNPRLKSNYKDLLTNSKYEEFVSSCGTHFVRYESRIGQIIAMVEISNLNSLVKEKLKIKYTNSLQGSFGDISSFKTNMSLSLDNFFQEAKKYGSVSIKYFAIGSDGISSISDIIANVNDFKMNKIAEGISEASKDFTKEKSAPSEHRLVSFQPFGLNEILINKLKNKKLNELQGQVYELYNAYDKILKLKTQRPVAYEEYYEDKGNKINELIDLKVNEIKDCYNSNECDTTFDNQYMKMLERIIWPEDAIRFTEVSIVPKYVQAYTSSGEKKQILKQLNLVGSALFFHNEYNRTIIVNYLNDQNNVIRASYNNSTNGSLSLSTPAIDDNGLKYQRGLMILDEIDINLKKFYNEKGRIVINEDLINTIQSTIDEFNRRQYLTTIKTNDLQSFSQPIVVPSSITIEAYK